MIHKQAERSIKAAKDKKLRKQLNYIFLITTLNEESPLIFKDVTKEFVHNRVELDSMELYTMYLGYMA